MQVEWLYTAPGFSFEESMTFLISVYRGVKGRGRGLRPFKQFIWNAGNEHKPLASKAPSWNSLYNFALIRGNNSISAEEMDIYFNCILALVQTFRMFYCNVYNFCYFRITFLVLKNQSFLSLVDFSRWMQVYQPKCTCQRRGFECIFISHCKQPVLHCICAFMLKKRRFMAFEEGS